MVRFRLLCGDFLLPNPAPHLENRKTVCMGYTAMTPQGRAGKRRRKGAGNPCRKNGTPIINWSKWPLDVLNDTMRHSAEEPSALRLTSCGHFDHMRWTAAAQFNVDNLSTLNQSVLQLTSTWQFVKPRWKVVSGQAAHLPPSHNAQILVGGHFEHQLDNCNALLYESSRYHFDNRHASVTF